MRARRFGKIFNNSSIGGEIYTPLGGWYHASEFALEGYSNVLMLKARPFGIDVVVIQPGGITSEWAGIACDQADRISGAGIYADLVQKFKSAKARLTSQPPPSIISGLIITALKTRNPRSRYAAALMAKPLLFLRRTLPDSLFDRFSMLGFP